MLRYLLYAVWGYLFGSILFGYWVPLKRRNVNIYEVSKDGNPGTANVFINCGFWCGAAVIVCDLLKGAIPIAIASRVLDMKNLWFSIVLVAPVLGTAFPPFWYHMRGGKGIAVSFGVTVGLLPLYQPLIFLAGLYIFFSIVWVIKTHRSRSIVTYLAFALLTVIFIKELAVKIGFTLISVIVVNRHLSDRTEMEGAVVHEGSHTKLQYRWRS